MNTVRVKQVLYWGTFSLLVLSALTWGVDRILPNDESLVVKQCRTGEKECVSTLSHYNGVATLSFENGVHANDPMLLSITLPSALAAKVQSMQITLQGKDHYMGVSTMELIQKPTPTQWKARVLLPESEKAVITWQLEVTTNSVSGDKHSAWFEFDVPPREAPSKLNAPKTLSDLRHS